MKKIILISCSILLIHHFSIAQTSTAERVYQILQANCATVYCHGSGAASGSLDLEGTGATVAEKMQDVYTNLVGATPSNTVAAGKGDHLIYKGRPDKSFLFRKINNGLESTIDLESTEGATMPDAGGTLTDVEKELFRQWILFGAPATGTVVEEALLTDYYVNNMGVESFPNGAPVAPTASEGFQIKMGPFFLAPQNNAQGWADELEFFQKWELDLPNNFEVTRLDTKMGTYSHHFIMYNYDTPGDAFSIPPGLRTYTSHTNMTLVEAVQEATDLRLPQGAAFKWDKNVVLDLNSHYINYDNSSVYKAEAYVNIYTEPDGTANQEMFTMLVPNTSINIPNNGNEYTFAKSLNFSLGEVYIWSMMGHTHELGTDYDVYLRNSNGTKGTKVYDGACPQGIPDCATPFFDYQHIPMRFYDPLMPITFNANNGIIHEAKYINTGSAPVGWGNTSDDEMMVLIFMGLTDTAGVVTDVKAPVSNALESIKIYPNPATNQTFLLLPDNVSDISFILYDVLGNEVQYIAQSTENPLVINRGRLQSGIYIYKIKDKNGKTKTGKIVFQ